MGEPVVTTHIIANACARVAISPHVAPVAVGDAPLDVDILVRSADGRELKVWPPAQVARGSMTRRGFLARLLLAPFAAMLAPLLRWLKPEPTCANTRRLTFMGAEAQRLWCGNRDDMLDAEEMLVTRAAGKLPLEAYTL